MTFPKFCTFFIFFALLLPHVDAQITPPNPTGDRAWDKWWQDNSVADVEREFNAARRNEENQLGLPSGTLGNLDLPADYLQRSSEEQALILVNAERTARHNVNYPSKGIVSGLPFEGVDLDLSAVAQGHADDMLNTGNFSHTGSDGKSSGERINAVFSGCNEGSGENIAWNSSGGFILSVPLAFYNFIYDDGFCCTWGHRVLCLNQNIFNNYGNPNKIGLVGFGRASGGNGDYFVMDYLDPEPDCTYNITNFGEDGSDACEEVLLVSGNITSDTYTASMEVQSDGTINGGETVVFKASNAVVLLPGFQTKNNATFTAMIGDCETNNLKQAIVDSRSKSNKPQQFKMGTPIIEHLTINSSTLQLSVAPNPATVFTTINFQVDKSSSARITLFDNLGRIVRDLTNEYSQGESKVSFDLNTSDLENGMYWINLSTEHESITKSLVIHR